MLAWKEKVAEKLSRLLADSPAFPSSTYPAADPQAISFSTEHFSSLKKPSLSSYVLSFLPTSNSNSVHEGRSPCSESMRPLPSESLPKRWRENDFTWNDRPPELSECGSESERDERNENSCNIHVLPQYRSVGNSNGNESSTSDSADARHLLTEKSAFVSSNLFEFFQSSLPGISKGCHWVLLYSTWKHGISLRTLLRRSENLQGPCLLIVGDMQGAVFGGLLHSPLKPTEKRKYQGTNQTFVFTTIYGEPRLFRATGANRYYYLCLNDALALGGGGNFALCLDEDLLHGTSGSCETFGNSCLAHSSEFELKNVELWGFTHSWSRPI